MDKTWYADLKDADTFYMKVLAIELVAFLDANSRGLHDTFYTKVLAIKLMAFLDANSGGLHAVDMLTLRTNMHGYYAQADGIPQYIIMLKEA